LSGPDLRTNISYWSRNTGLCALTEQVIFTDPYTTSAVNRWTTPQLDTYALGIKADNTLKIAASALKHKFLTQTEALVHGDLHTGSVMCTEGSTYVIDPEFAFYGPIGFDVGAMLANLFLAYFSQFGHGLQSNADRSDYAEFILIQLVTFYEQFEAGFLQLWSNNTHGADSITRNVGDMFPVSLFEHGDGTTCLAQAQAAYKRKIFVESLGFAGCKMLRRVVGIAHVADMDTIKDDTVRSVCEKRALLFARELIVYSSFSDSDNSTVKYANIRDVVALAKSLNSQEPPADWTAMMVC
jgi:5-methylthioribose kinase